jgi:hypothetical protein
MPLAQPGFIARTEESDDAHGFALNQAAIVRVGECGAEQRRPRSPVVLN